MNIRVCIVEDDRPLRAIFVDWLKQSRGIQFVKEYPNAEEAIQDMPSCSPDVVLMDIHLPGVDGIECVRRLKVKLPATLFIMFTVYEDDNRIFDALAAGACGYLLKQTSKTVLIRAIRDAVDGGSPMSSSIARRVVHSFQCQNRIKRERKPAKRSPPAKRKFFVCWQAVTYTKKLPMSWAWPSPPSTALSDESMISSRFIPAHKPSRNTSALFSRLCS